MWSLQAYLYIPEISTGSVLHLVKLQQPEKSDPLTVAEHIYGIGAPAINQTNTQQNLRIKKSVKHVHQKSRQVHIP